VNIFDPLYGRFELPNLSGKLCTQPEVRRLSQVRLLNSITPTLATLSELRRYAHTLGVLHLFSVWKHGNGRRFPTKDVDALEVAIILHDVATPPFGHLFEYVLKETLGWDHESAAVSTLLKDHSPASTAKPIFAGRTPKVLDYLDRLDVDLATVKAILTKQHALSSLIFGVVDFDNLDNVLRMCWALGIRHSTNDASEIEDLASSLDVMPDGKLLLTGQGPALLSKWAALRRAAYDVLVFDQSTVASQALLTYTIKQGLERGLISPEDWLLHDESLLLKLSADPLLKQIIDRQYLGQLPTPVLSVQFRWAELPFFDLPRQQVEDLLRETLQPVIGSPLWIYVFKERGSFEKEVRYQNDGSNTIKFGTTSRSLIVSIFTDKSLSNLQVRNASHVCMDLFARHGLGADDVLRSLVSGDDARSQQLDL